MQFIQDLIVSTGSHLADEFLVRHHADKGINCSAFPSVFIQPGVGTGHINYEVKEIDGGKSAASVLLCLIMIICHIKYVESKGRLMFCSTEATVIYVIFVTLKIQVAVTLE